MNAKKKTLLFTTIVIPVLILLIFVFDAYVIAEGGTEASISHLILEWSYKYPLITFGIGFSIGFLSGHLFWRIRDTKTTKELSDESRL